MEPTAKDIETYIPKSDKRAETCLMGLTYDIMKKNPGIKTEQISLLAASQMQKRDPMDFGLYKYTQDKKAKGFKLKKVDWSDALAQYSQEKISSWENEAQKKGVNMQDYVLDNISKNLVIGYHPSGIKTVDASLDRMLSEDCSKAASENFDKKEKQVQNKDNTVLLSAVQKALTK